MRKSWSLALGLFGLALLCGGALFFGSTFRSPSATRGLSLGGHVPPAGVSLDQWMILLQRQLAGRRVVLGYPVDQVTQGVPWTATEYEEGSFEEVGIEFDLERSRERVRALADSRGWLERWALALGFPQPVTDLTLDWTFHEETAAARISAFAERIRTAPVDARLDLRAHQRVRERPGRELDVAGTLSDLRSAERDDGTLVALAVRDVPAAVRLSQLLEIDVSRVLSSYETGFGGTGAGRAVNIAQAAQYLSGTVILPGQKVSFNAMVGPRTLSRGFTWAPEIFDDELRPGVGGGVCQVASTFHAAAVLGLLDVPRRRAHSRPSSYLPLGLDAMVMFGEVDLVVRNPHATPVIVHAFLPTKNTLRVELLGLDAPGKVTYSFIVTKRHDFYRRVTTKPSLGAARVRKQKGGFGYDVVSHVRIVYPDKSYDTRQYLSEYRPTPEVYWVGPSADGGGMPELPAGAEYVEIDGARNAPALPSSETPEGS